MERWVCRDVWAGPVVHCGAGPPRTLFLVVALAPGPPRLWQQKGGLGLEVDSDSAGTIQRARKRIPTQSRFQAGARANSGKASRSSPKSNRRVAREERDAARFRQGLFVPFVRFSSPSGRQVLTEAKPKEEEGVAGGGTRRCASFRIPSRPCRPTSITPMRCECREQSFLFAPSPLLARVKGGIFYTFRRFGH